MVGAVLATFGCASAAPEPELPKTCFEAWQHPVLEVKATSRPKASTELPALYFTVNYAVPATGFAHIVIDQIEAGEIVEDSDGPFSVQTSSGSWIELQDAAGKTLYTQLKFELIPESVEASGPNGIFQNIVECPHSGRLRLTGFPNRPEARSLVFFQNPVDGVAGTNTVEFARFELP